ncbi:response regulator [Telmatospirillum siberiense]|uniref:Response regulatory domain-containing protein n=1 Tax=Telmatospirillum siberiense TaxID=382514 RepID=A0A2N3PXJ6_9PROT|nr:response regulator [Telmatospirillum siberiense]PKU25136.1 hypothetical protein CWS72_08025 [Telmatospirillum siberiense]
MSGYSLENARVLVVDGNRDMRRVVCGMLRAFGVRAVTEAANGREAFDSLRSSPADIILCDRCTRPVDGDAFVRMVRNADDSPNPFAIVLVLSAATAPHHIADARAAGAHDVLCKPLSAKALFARIRTIIEYPRPFIRTPDYFGPSQRWQQTDFEGMDRRRTPPRAVETDAWGQVVDEDPPVVVTPEEIRALLYDDYAEDVGNELYTPPEPASSQAEDVWYQPKNSGSPSEPLLIPVPPQFQLRVPYSPWGVDDDAVLRADAAIRDLQDDYLIRVRKDLSRLQIFFRRARAAAPGERTDNMRALFEAAYDMAGQGGSFGYPLITEIAAQLCHFISDRIGFGEVEMRAVRLHIDALRVVVAERLEGDGGDNRKELIRGLQAIRANIAKREEVWMPGIRPGTTSLRTEDL